MALMAARRVSSFLALGFVSYCLTSCGGEEGPAAAGGGPSLGGPEASALPYQPCAPEDEVGEFVIELASEYTRVGGRVSDRINPIQVSEVVASEGECQLLTPPTLLCDPGCPASTETCGAGNICVPLQRNHDLGTVTVHGMVVPLEMTPNANTRSYANPAIPRLPHPGFEPGADLRITTGGGDYEPFELRGWGISLLELPPEPTRVQSGAASAVRWGAPAEAGPARMHVSLNINNHGSNEASVECDFPDTGEAEIPATLIDGLIAQGFSGDPTITLTRRTATSVAIEPGCVELLVSSGFEVDADVEGVISCDDRAEVSECPAGQTCIPVERYCR